LWKDLEEARGIESTSQIEEQIIQAELIYLTLAELAPKLRECLRLAMYGCSCDEIAQTLGINPTSVGTYMSMARKQFRLAYARLA
jgi:DNA-binding CsgD family transcriptional regulator